MSREAGDEQPGMVADDPDPDMVMLCQMPGLDAALLRRLLQRWQSPERVLAAPSGELRGLGVPPAVVARIVAAPRQRSGTEAGIRSLLRMGVRPLALPDPNYPRRLWADSDPPLLLYVQGQWPPLIPIVALAVTGNLDETHRSAVTSLFGALHQHGITTMAACDIDCLPATASVAVLPYGLLLARNRVPEGIRTAATQNQATLISVAPVNAPETPVLEAAARNLVALLADGLITTESDLPLGLRPETHVWRLTTEEAPGRRKSRLVPANADGARKIARALGLTNAGTATVQQERLW